MRYTVHEKLQNFTAPEDRGTWGERAADELFGSLFGRRMGLGEDVEEEEVEGEGEGEEEEAGLMMFRS
jgi:protein AATF/BFR2